MSSYTATTAVHATLAASTVDTVTLSPRGTDDTAAPAWIEVLNRDSAGTVYFRVDGTTPTVAGNDCYVVLPGSALRVTAPPGASTVATELISSSASMYSVTGGH